ncbi:DUF3007 family protein [Geitlerinema sp. PCC 7407]|uniref:DUF3007 family protein n=1 Tax=Geitlerinema sp. PCC 7407 TaxID=1173025 RepID=UPI00029FF1E1|nr:DUF3007 family protein [Geitlerinema sp. PCC 7407]AFY65096.1 hypothetical protein GEI7407_0598 [Geitlerinema sp. PCC 7407]
MRRIDVLLIGVGVFALGGGAYVLLKVLGLEATDAGIWSQVILVLALLGWLASYLFRAVTQQMTYNRQVQDYKDAVLQKQLEELSPEELAALQAQIEAEETRSPDSLT